MLKYIVAVLLVVGVWVAWFFLVPELILIPLVFTGLVVAFFVGLFVIRRVRARRAARELEKALAAQAQEHARMARPDQLAEIQQMQAEFQRAVGSLKTSKLGEGQDALYALPWQVIIGPPGAGKSTALRNSGLQFPYLSAKGGGLRGVGGTRNCDWWLTNESVILDTAGRWTTEDEDRDEWYSFLDLLKKTRPDGPLNGIICAIAVGDLGSASEDEVHALANKMRARIDEIMDRLQMSLPVYVLFTKCDLLPGFVDVFGDMAKDERGQVWGFTAPVTEPIGEPGNYFSERFDELIDSVEKKSILRLGEERKLDARERIFAFPQQVSVLKKNLAAFVSSAFTENAFKDSPKLRGAYFTSGTQEGRPIDLVMSRMAEAFGISNALPTKEITDSKSYFLRDVFRKVVFPDAELAAWSSGEQAAQRRARIGAAIAIFGLAFLILTVPAYAWWQNRDLIAGTSRVVDAVSEAPEGAHAGGPESLIEVRNEVAKLRSGPGLVLDRLGMYQGEDLKPELEHMFTKLFQERVLQPIHDADVRTMQAFGTEFEAGDHQPSASEHRTNYDLLKAHLLLTTPKEDAEPGGASTDGISPEQATWLEQFLLRRWANELNLDMERESDSSRLEEMTKQVHLYIQLAASSPDDQNLPRDERVVVAVRQAINLVPSENLAIESLIGEFENRGYDLRLSDMVGTTVHQMTDERTIRGAFTRRAWESAIRDRLATGNVGQLPGAEAWVLGREIPSAGDENAEEQRLSRLRSQYFRAYIEEWMEFIKGVRVRPPDGNEEALALMQDLNRGTPSPYGLLFRTVAYNATLKEVEDEAASAAEGEAQSSTARELRNRMRRSTTGRLLADAIMGGNGSDQEPGGNPEFLIERGHVSIFFEGFTSFGVSPPVAEGQAPLPTSLDSYMEQLVAVRDAIRTQTDSPGEDASTALLAALQTARTRTRALVNEQIVGWRPYFDSLLWPPIDGASMSSTRAMAMGAGRSWCSEVYSPFRHNLDGRYPFDRAGLDVPLADFTAFFLPTDGTLWSFYDQVLDPAIDRDGDEFEFSTHFSRNGDFQHSVLSFLESAHTLTTGFFPPGAEGPKVEFDVRIRPSPDVAIQYFRIGGTEVEYHNGPEQWTRVSWPGESPEAGAELEVRGADDAHEKIQQAGEWGFFRLLDQGEVSGGAGTGVFSMTWRVRTHNIDITLDLRPVRGDTPFFGLRGREQEPVLLYPIRTPHVAVPREIVSNARNCTVR